MAKSREISMNLPKADDLFSTQAERDEAVNGVLNLHFFGV